ncbi:hypothetical protein CEXT_451251 [Caerostris extrusa]|uniref:Uncharacterized protein n=1 Tax=Caerostris extrusa TaxID=172846 RepID=A0AAV4QLE0_CAEEX|nr:hypothetical protein CEXT_451251 [Caerostris extrusa]
MPPISLYESLFYSNYRTDKTEHWSEEKENPFSRLPPRIVELLVEFCGTSQKIRKFSYFRMLLSIGKLRKLKLCFPVFFTDICIVLPQMLTEKGCINIKVLELDPNFENDESEWLEKLLQKLPLMESLCTNTHLCIVSRHDVPVNAISKYCFNLEYLKIIGNATVCDSIKSSYNFRMLKKTGNKFNQRKLCFVFQNVRNLKELQFHNAAVFDDLRLQEILNRDPLAFNHLDKVFMRDYMISREGFRIFPGRRCKSHHSIHQVKSFQCGCTNRFFGRDKRIATIC